MTHVLQARNVNHAFKEALWYIRVVGKKEESRNGPVLVAPGPVITEYERPIERVLFNPKRDANPVFHLMEALWMLAGDSKLEFVVQFNARMASYGENGIQWGAYGKRWYIYFGKNQIVGVINELMKNPNSRRAVIGIWDPCLDLTHEGPDVPCNTTIYLDLRNDVLNMTVCCRSNDMLWGAYGANAVHFSILQEVIAHELRVPMGVYRQFSNNFHIYTDLPMVQDFLATPPSDPYDYYEEGRAEIMPILYGSETYYDLVSDCKNLVMGGSRMTTDFMNEVAVPLRNAYLERKAGMEIVLPQGPTDWNVAFREWVERRGEIHVSE